MRLRKSRTPHRFKISYLAWIMVSQQNAVCPAAKKAPPYKNGVSPTEPFLSGASLYGVLVWRI